MIFIYYVKINKNEISLIKKAQHFCWTFAPPLGES
jgi:hypothetical protein